MTLKLWDLNKESAPVATYNVHEHLRARVRARGEGRPRADSLSNGMHDRVDVRTGMAALGCTDESDAC